MVATARLLSIRSAAWTTAAPPRLCPMSSLGGSRSSDSQRLAATRSSVLELNVVSANSPSLEPSPVKSNRSVAMPAAASAPVMCRIASRLLPQVKQWANSA